MSDDEFIVPIKFQLQHALGSLGRADNQCAECGVYRADGKPPLIHRETCESSGTAEHYRQMSSPPPDPWIDMGRAADGAQLWWAPEGTVPPTDSTYGPGYTDGDDS